MKLYFKFTLFFFLNSVRKATAITAICTNTIKRFSVIAIYVNILNYIDTSAGNLKFPK